MSKTIIKNVLIAIAIIAILTTTLVLFIGFTDQTDVKTMDLFLKNSYTKINEEEIEFIEERIYAELEKLGLSAYNPEQALEQILNIQGKQFDIKLSRAITYKYYTEKLYIRSEAAEEINPEWDIGDVSSCYDIPVVFIPIYNTSGSYAGNIYISVVNESETEINFSEAVEGQEPIIKELEFVDAEKMAVKALNENEIGQIKDINFYVGPLLYDSRMTTLSSPYLALIECETGDYVYVYGTSNYYFPNFQPQYGKLYTFDEFVNGHKELQKYFAENPKTSTLGGNNLGWFQIVDPDAIPEKYR